LVYVNVNVYARDARRILLDCQFPFESNHLTNFPKRAKLPPGNLRPNFGSDSAAKVPDTKRVRQTCRFGLRTSLKILGYP
jgi:hypothetical protein